MKTIDKNAAQLDLFADTPSLPQLIAMRSQIEPVGSAQVFTLHDIQAVRAAQDEQRITRKVLALLDL